MPTSPSIDELNQRFGVSGVASITAGNNGLPRVCVNIPPATAENYLHGAQLTSWHPAGAGEVIFLKPARAVGARTRDSRRHTRLFPLVSQ